MQRAIVYAGSIPLETDILKTNQYAMVGLAKLSAAVFGASGVVVNGLAAVPTSPAGLTINVNPGELYSLQSLEATAYSSLPADTTHSVLKQGVSLDAVNLSCPAPATAGFSINYLVQATFQEADTTLVALPYYNASNPTSAWSGPNNSGTPQATIRSGNIVISAKAGTAATTGSQTTPAPDAGYTGLWVVTVANGQTQITAPNIVQATNAPILPADLLHSIQQNALTTAVDTGTANTYAVSYSPAITALTDGMVLWFKAKTANTGASTLNVNGLGASPLVGAAHSALQGGELVVGGRAQVVWRADISSWVLESCTGAALQLAPATQSQHAMQLGQATGRLLAMRVFTSSGTYTPTAGTKSVLVEAVGGGGGGGGSQAASASQVAIASGGGSGAYARSYFTTGFSGVTMTIGAAGSGGAAGANSGGTGGSTSFGALLTVGAGSGGVFGGAASPAYVQTGGIGASQPTSGNISNTAGTAGSLGIAISLASFVSGAGGQSPYGAPGGLVPTASAPGGAASGNGCGGGGAATLPNGAAKAGGNGSPGLIIVWEFA